MVETADIHAVLVPGPGVGHFNGAMLVSKALLAAGFSAVTIAVYAKCYSVNEKKIKSMVAWAAAAGGIRLEVLNDGLDGGDKHYHALFSVTPEMKRSLHEFLVGCAPQPCCLIADAFMAWTHDVADAVDLPRIDLWTASATSYLLIISVPSLISNHHIPLPDGPPKWKSEKPRYIDWVPGLPDFPFDELPDDFTHPPVVEDDDFLQRCITASEKAQKVERVLIHTESELEAATFKGFAAAYPRMRAYAMGPLIQYAPRGGGGDDDGKCLRWLERWTESSVIYVSFGSNATMAAAEVEEMAAGLMGSEQPFVWVLRSDLLKGGGDAAEAARMPEGFPGEKGLVVSWAPQVALLEHKSVGGFLTHCGWNSTLESLWEGVPLLGCPRGADQRLNIRLISREWCVGLEMDRTDTGSFTRAHVEAGVRAILTSDAGRLARSKARELSSRLRTTYSSSPSPALLSLAHDMRLRMNPPR